MNPADLAQYGIAVILVGYMVWRDKIMNKTIQNHFAHSEMAFKEMMDVVKEDTRAMTAASHTMEEVKKKITGCPYNA